MKKNLSILLPLLATAGRAMASVLPTEEVAEVVNAQASHSRGNIIGLCLFGLTIVIFVVLVATLIRLNRRCPQCGKSRALHLTDEREEIESTPRQRIYKVAYKCSHCGHTEWRKEAEDIDKQ